MPKDDQNPAESADSIAITLSGGGLRATLFELGILLCLSRRGDLENVRAIVSVSGGSILAAYLATQWDRVICGHDCFMEVASEVVKLTQRNIRDSSLIRYLWYHFPLLITYCIRRRSRAFFLSKQYDAMFGNATFETIPADGNRPEFAFVATDTTARQRVAMMPQGVFRFSFNGKLQDRWNIPSGGITLSLAVTASSCFPPVFNHLRLTYKELKVKYREFQETLTLRDGGIAGNLGVEMLAELMEHGVISAARLMVCDAERDLTEKPAESIYNVAAAQGEALSDAARQRANAIGLDLTLFSFAIRPDLSVGLAFDVCTALANYRTDLDCPTWDECNALLIHGAAVCETAIKYKGGTKTIKRDEIREMIQHVIEAAGGPKDLGEPDENVLQRCGTQPKRRVLSHLAAAVVVTCLFWSVLAESGSRLAFASLPRPLTRAYRLFAPEAIIDAKIEEISREVAGAACGDAFPETKKRLEGRRYRMQLVANRNSSATTVYWRNTEHPGGCSGGVECEFDFLGQFDSEKVYEGVKVQIVGRLKRVASNSARKNVYLDFEECRIAPIR